MFVNAEEVSTQTAGWLRKFFSDCVSVAQSNFKLDVKLVSQNGTLLKDDDLLIKFVSFEPAHDD